MAAGGAAAWLDVMLAGNGWKVMGTRNALADRSISASAWPPSADAFPGGVFRKLASCL